MTSTTMQSLIRNLQASDVTKADAVRCGDSLFGNEDACLAIFTDHNVIACPYSEFVVSVLNPDLLRNLIRTKKLFSFALGSSPKELKKTFLGIPVFFKIKAGLYPSNVIDKVWAKSNSQLVTDMAEVSYIN